MLFCFLSLLANADELIHSKRIENHLVRNTSVNIDFYFDKSIKKDSFYNENNLVKYFNYYSNIHSYFYSNNENKNCGSNELNIYVLPKSKMNNRSIMNNWISGEVSSQHSSNKVNLVGLFKYTNNESNIYLQKVANNKGLYFAHELSHFWYRKKCNNVYKYDENENMAMEFERKLINNKLLEKQ